MNDKDAKPVYAPLPARAIGDQRMHGLHFRVLAAIAYHDRLSAHRDRGRGQGCWAGNQTLARECGCNYRNLSTAITELGRWGYVTKEPHPINHRLRIYRVSYSPQDSLPTGEQYHSSTVKLPNVIVRPDFGNSEQVQLDGDVEYIPRKREDIRLKPSKDILRNSVGDETANVVDAEQDNIGAELAKLERAMKHGALGNIKHVDRVVAFLQDAIDSTEYGDPNHGRAERLLSEIEA